jgi:hypothetical protein
MNQSSDTAHHEATFADAEQGVDGSCHVEDLFRGGDLTYATHASVVCAVKVVPRSAKCFCFGEQMPHNFSAALLLLCR